MGAKNINTHANVCVCLRPMHIAMPFEMASFFYQHCYHCSIKNETYDVKFLKYSMTNAWHNFHIIRQTADTVRRKCDKQCHEMEIISMLLLGIPH